MHGATGDDIDSKSGATEPVCLLASGEENEENKTEPVCSETSVQLEKCPKTLPEATQTLSAPASPWNTTQFGTNLDTEPKELPLRCGLNAQQMAMGEGQMMMGPDDTTNILQCFWVLKWHSWWGVWKCHSKKSCCQQTKKTSGLQQIERLNR